MNEGMTTKGEFITCIQIKIAPLWTARILHVQTVTQLGLNTIRAKKKCIATESFLLTGVEKRSICADGVESLDRSTEALRTALRNQVTVSPGKSERTKTHTVYKLEKPAWHSLGKKAGDVVRSVKDLGVRRLKIGNKV